MQPNRVHLAHVLVVGLAAMSLSACGALAGSNSGTVVAQVPADGSSPTPPAQPDAPTPTPSATPTRAPLPDRASATSTKHPDPCGVDNDRDMIEREHHFFEAPAGRVEAAAKELFGDRFLGVYIAHVLTQSVVQQACTS